MPKKFPIEIETLQPPPLSAATATWNSAKPILTDTLISIPMETFLHIGGLSSRKL